MRLFRGEENNGNNRRNFVVIIAFVLAFVILACSLADLQIIRRQDYVEAATVKHTRTLKIDGSRGKILDSNGIPLARDEVSYNLEFYREYNLKSERRIHLFLG